jgi:CubicO group peptidase (beta-lactamase class C family)
MRQTQTPGASLALIHDFDVVWVGGFGVARIAEPRMISGDTLFQAASISKPVFALAVMRLAMSRHVDLDVDVNSYLTSWRVPDNRGWQPHVTLRQLLSHTAGMTVEGFVGYPMSGPWPTLSDILAGIPPANNPPVVVDRLPGLQTRYSGGGVTVAHQVIADVIGRPLPELMRELILDPLQMTRSTFEQPLPLWLTSNAAIGHPWNGLPIFDGWNVYPEMAAAGLWTTANDLARLGVELLRILRGDDSVLGLDRATIGEMLRPQLPGQEIGQEFRGLGWRCKGRGDAFRFGHRGANIGYSSSIILLPARGQGAVVLLNSNQGFQLIDEIVQAIARQYSWPLAQLQKSITLTPLDAACVGQYRDTRGLTFTVTAVDGQTFLQFGHQPPLLLKPSSRLEFFADALDLQVRFETAEDGAIAAMTIINAGDSIVARKQNAKKSNL